MLCLEKAFWFICLKRLSYLIEKDSSAIQYRTWLFWCFELCVCLLEVWHVNTYNVIWPSLWTISFMMWNNLDPLTNWATFIINHLTSEYVFWLIYIWVMHSWISSGEDHRYISYYIKLLRLQELYILLLYF